MMTAADGPRRFVVTVDDPGGLIQDLAIFDRVRRFFDAEGVPASFMVVPRGEGGWQLDTQPEWLAALHAAEADGHDCQLHGLDHWNCEFGPYHEIVRWLGGDPDGELARDTAKFGHLWRPEVYVEKLNTALGIFGEAFGRRPLVFRTGALSQTPELYDAMAQVGLKYASNLVVDRRGWAYIIEKYDDPGDWDPDVPPHAYYLNDDVINLPIASEYAWYLTEAKIAPHLALAVDDLERIYGQGGVFILVCHVQCVGAEDGLSQQLLSQLIRIAREDFGAEFATLTGLVGEIEAGELSVLRRL
jgi:peptidoglycan/xylan/chitin deacetylase (PgdA/CDA1 family)